MHAQWCCKRLLESGLRRRVRLAVVVGLACLSASPLSAQTRPRPNAGTADAIAFELAFLDEPGTPRERESVRLRVLANGDVHCFDGRALVPCERLTENELLALERELLVDGNLAALSSDTLQSAVESACRSAGFATEIEGAATTIIRFESDGVPREVRCDALSVMAARFPDFPEVQRLFNAQLRLQNVAAVAEAGGSAAAEQLAAIANETLAASRPDLPPLSPADLSMYRALSTGNRYVQFYRRPAESREELLVSLYESPGTAPRVSILATPVEPVQ
jgi:hypothetical protein